MHEFVITALSVHMPNVLRWAGAVARELRRHNIGLEGKGTGSAAADALTLADLSLQELIVSALRDTDPIFRHCRIEAEESTGDLTRFSTTSDLTIGLDPIDGTRIYRDRDGNGYSVMLHLRSKAAVLYSLVYIPEMGEHGWWVEATGEQIVSGPDDPSRTALDVLKSLPPVNAARVTATRGADSKAIKVVGFQHRDTEAARRITGVGLQGIPMDEVDGCTYELIARGVLGGALVHSPNVYDFPVTAHLCRNLGGDAVWVKDGQSMTFQQVMLDQRCKMFRVPGIVACAVNRESLQTLVNLARDWNQERYRDGDEL